MIAEAQLNKLGARLAMYILSSKNELTQIEKKTCLVPFVASLSRRGKSMRAAPGFEASSTSEHAGSTKRKLRVRAEDDFQSWIILSRTFAQKSL
ncbi:MAG TPA: hypothetical protein VID20_04420 [Sphingomicrobium sp.]|jgi:hypothetical protein